MTTPDSPELTAILALPDSERLPKLAAYLSRASDLAQRARAERDACIQRLRSGDSPLPRKQVAALAGVSEAHVKGVTQYRS